MKKSLVFVFLFAVLLIMFGALGSASNHTDEDTTPDESEENVETSSEDEETSEDEEKTTTPLVTNERSFGREISSGDEKKAIDSAYQCLEDEIEGKSSFSLQEAIFGTLALGNEKKLMDKLEDEKHKTEACWPSGKCTIKDTAQVALAYDRAGKKTDDIDEWLLDHNISTPELLWFIEIDNPKHEATSCTVSYDDRNYNVRIDDEMKLSGGAGSCLPVSESGYWLRINSNCLNKEYQVSCESDFISAVIYQKNAGDTVYVSSETHSAPSLGTTKEQVSAACFSSGRSCDYEGTLWASLALQKAGEDVSAFLPYLVAFAEDNREFFPSSFLHILTADEEYFSEIIQSKKQDQYWELIGNNYNRFYDSSLGMLALGSSSSTEVEVVKTQSYLLNIQQDDGCWNNKNVRDTAFVLYSGWSKAPNKGGSGSGGSVIGCEEAGLTCESVQACAEIGGLIKSEYECTGFGVCCSEAVEQVSCEEQNGELCKIRESCDGETFDSSQGSCCLGSCVEQEESNSCEELFGTCSSSCSDGEEEISESCTRIGDVCCIPAPKPGTNWPLIIGLGILILLAIIGIVKRDSIKMWWFKRKGGARSAPVIKPGVPPSGSSFGAMRPSPRRSMPPRYPTRSRTVPQQAQPPQRQRVKDTEMDDTLRKLKEMSK